MSYSEFAEPTAHLAMCNGGVLTPDQDLLRKALHAAVDAARAGASTEDATDA